MPSIINILHLGHVFWGITSFHLLCTPPYPVLWVCFVQVAAGNGRHLLFGVYWLNIRGYTSVQELASGRESHLHGNHRINNQLHRFVTNPTQNLISSLYLEIWTPLLSVRRFRTLYSQFHIPYYTDIRHKHSTSFTCASTGTFEESYFYFQPVQNTSSFLYTVQTGTRVHTESWSTGPGDSSRA
jgi:hypothetical protein